MFSLTQDRNGRIPVLSVQNQFDVTKEEFNVMDALSGTTQNVMESATRLMIT